MRAKTGMRLCPPIRGGVCAAERNRKKSQQLRRGAVLPLDPEPSHGGGAVPLKQVAKEVSLDLKGAYLNLNGGFDSARSRKCIFNARLIPILKENLRNRQTT
jgi:hypothetical protein